MTKVLLGGGGREKKKKGFSLSLRLTDTTGAEHLYRDMKTHLHIDKQRDGEAGDRYV